MEIAAQLHNFWQEFAATRTTDPAIHFLEAFYVDDNEPSANELAALVLAGRKHETWISKKYIPNCNKLQE